MNAWKAVRAVLGPFVLSRALIFLIWAIGACMVVEKQPDTPEGFTAHLIELRLAPIAERFERFALANDAGWYLSIARDGYEARPFDASEQANWAFFPLHPALWAAASSVIGSHAIAGLLLCNALFLAGLAVTRRLMIGMALDEPLVDRAVWLLAFAPTAYFFSLPWSESLFLCTSAATWLAFQKRAWGMLAVFGAAAAATRLVSLFLFAGIVIELWRLRHEVPWKAWAAAAAMPASLGLFMAHLWQRTGDPLAFAHIQSAWGRQLAIPYKALGIVLWKPLFLASDWNLRHLNAAAFVIAMAAAVWLARRKQTGLAVFCALSVLAPALSGSITSMARYTFALFPVFIALAAWTNTPGRERAVFVTSAALLTALVASFGAGFALAGA